MRRFHLLFAVLIFFVGFAAPAVAQDAAPLVSSCATDAEIPAAERDSVNRAALDFVLQALDNPAAAYSSMTDDAKKEVSADKFANMFQQGVKPVGPFSDWHVAHTYVAKVAGGEQVQRVPCGTLSRPQDWVAVNTRPGPAQAHVVVEGTSVNNSWVFVLWLWPDQEHWRVEYLQFAMEKVVGKSADDFQTFAETERKAQHNFNTFILYVVALQLSDRGPTLQLGIRPDIEKAVNDLNVPRELQGRPPFEWEFSKSRFKVLSVAPIGVGGKIYLELDHEVEPWTDNKVPENINHELLAGFAQAYPEYKSAFSGLVAMAHERGGTRSFGTVDENQH